GFCGGATTPSKCSTNRIVLLLAVSVSANYNYGHSYLPSTYGSYYGHRYGGYSVDGDRNTDAVQARIVDDDQVAISPNALPELIYSPQSPAPSPSTIEAILITRGIGRQPATPADATAYSVTGVPAARYIPDYLYGSPVIYGYSFGPYTYYSPSVLSPYSYGSYGSYDSYPYGYLYKK
ncbi:hypothetical protein AVEN_240859-1, partial [Araneus ventricosus]